MKTNRYILKGKKAIPIKDVVKWSNWFEKADRIVKQESIKPGGVWISTVFLGLDHNFSEGKPILFETMVFTSKKSMKEIDVVRYSTWEEAEKGHKEMVKKLKRGE